MGQEKKEARKERDKIANNDSEMAESNKVVLASLFYARDRSIFRLKVLNNFIKQISA